jgi:hypothetical protein
LGLRSNGCGEGDSGGIWSIEISQGNSDLRSSDEPWSAFISGLNILLLCSGEIGSIVGGKKEGCGRSEVWEVVGREGEGVVGGVKGEGVRLAVTKNHRGGVGWRDLGRKSDMSGVISGDRTCESENCTVVRWKCSSNILFGPIGELHGNHKLFLLNSVLIDNCNWIVFPSRSPKYNVSKRIRNENGISQGQILEVGGSEDEGEIAGSTGP